MSDINPQERQLREEIRWTKEAVLLVNNSEGSPELRNAFMGIIPPQYAHLTEIYGGEDSLKDHLRRLQSDLSQLQNGEWETEEGGQKHE